MIVRCRRVNSWQCLFTLTVAVWLSCVWTPRPAGAAEAWSGTAAPAATHYLGREIARTMHYSGAAWLVRESRQREEDCQRLLEELQIRPGQVVCDMGCGNGFYALQLAQLTGERGKVFAVDIQQEMLNILKRRARQAQVANIVAVPGTATDPGLPENGLDLVLMVDVYHEFSHPATMLRAIRASLKPTGRVALAEFRTEDPEVPIKPLHKMSKKQILREFQANGLKLVRQFDGLPWQHLMFFTRADLPPANGKRRAKADREKGASLPPPTRPSHRTAGGTPPASNQGR